MGLGDNKTTGVADLNGTRNDDQQAIVVKQEENQRSSAETNNKVIAPSLENDDSGDKDPEEAVCYSELSGKHVDRVLNDKL